MWAWSSGRIHGTRSRTRVSNAAMRLQPRKRSFLVGANEPAVARDVRGKRGQVIPAQAASYSCYGAEYIPDGAFCQYLKMHFK
jgi:hypothetical protein